MNLINRVFHVVFEIFFNLPIIDLFLERNLTMLPTPETCRPLYVGSFLRHGTRNPSDGDIEEVQQLMDRIGESRFLRSRSDHAGIT